MRPPSVVASNTRMALKIIIVSVLFLIFMARTSSTKPAAVQTRFRQWQQQQHPGETARPQQDPPDHQRRATSGHSRQRQ